MIIEKRMEYLNTLDDVISCQINNSISYIDDFLHTPNLLIRYKNRNVLEDLMVTIDRIHIERMKLFVPYYLELGYEYQIKQIGININEGIKPIYDTYNNKFGEFNRMSLLFSFMKMSQDISNRSTCIRRKVGCIIAPNDLSNIVSMGYNGSAPKEENGCKRLESGNCGCIHAEINALNKFKPMGGVDYVLICTLTPCLNCSMEIIKYPIKRVVYLDEYRDMSGYHFLVGNNIEVINYNSIK